MLLLGGGGGVGYFARGATASAGETPPARVSPERMEAVEREQAVQRAILERDREERIEATRAARESAAASIALRDTLITVVEQVKAMDGRVSGLDTRLQRVEHAHR